MKGEGVARCPVRDFPSTLLVAMLAGAAPATVDCCGARCALAAAEYGVDNAVRDETAASERYIVAYSEAEATRLRRERDQRRERRASRRSRSCSSDSRSSW